MELLCSDAVIVMSDRCLGQIERNGFCLHTLLEGFSELSGWSLVTCCIPLKEWLGLAQLKPTASTLFLGSAVTSALSSRKAWGTVSCTKWEWGQGKCWSDLNKGREETWRWEEGVLKQGFVQEKNKGDTVGKQSVARRWEFLVGQKKEDPLEKLKKEKGRKKIGEEKGSKQSCSGGRAINTPWEEVFTPARCISESHSRDRGPHLGCKPLRSGKIRCPLTSTWRNVITTDPSELLPTFRPLWNNVLSKWLPLQWFTVLVMILFYFLHFVHFRVHLGPLLQHWKDGM